MREMWADIPMPIGRQALGTNGSGGKRESETVREGNKIKGERGESEKKSEREIERRGERCEVAVCS